MLIAPAAPAPPLPVPDTCVFEAPCVYATPDASPMAVKDETRTYYGRGWKPGTTIGIGFGSPCYDADGDGEVACTLELNIRRSVVTVDADGRFTLVARNGETSDAGSVAADEVDGFDGFAPSGRGVGRAPRRVPAPSTPAQRAEGAAIVGVTKRLLDDLGHARKRTIPASDAEQREVGRCRDILRIEHPAARAKVIDRVVDAASDAATYGKAHPELVAFARRLRALHVTDPQLAGGVSAWSAAIAKRHWAPKPSLCAALRRWRAKGYPPAHPPIPRGETAFADDVARGGALAAATERLVDLGLPRTPWVEQFGGRALGLENYIAF